jgi:hypothetical protein
MFGRSTRWPDCAATSLADHCVPFELSGYSIYRPKQATLERASGLERL